MALSRNAMLKRYQRELPRYERASESLVSHIEAILHDLGPNRRLRPVESIKRDVKEFDSLYKKACTWQNRGDVKTVADCFDRIPDIARARIVCRTIEDAEQTARLLTEQQRIITTERTETHSTPDTNESGYRAIHLDVLIDALVDGEPRATLCELQIMTALQHAWALYTLPIYKSLDDVPPLVRHLMREVSDLLNVTDRVVNMLLVELEIARAPSSTARAQKSRKTSAPRASGGR